MGCRCHSQISIAHYYIMPRKGHFSRTILPQGRGREATRQGSREMRIEVGAGQPFGSAPKVGRMKPVPHLRRSGSSHLSQRLRGRFETHEIRFPHASSDFGFAESAALAPKYEKYKLWKSEFRNSLLRAGLVPSAPPGFYLRYRARVRVGRVFPFHAAKARKTAALRSSLRCNGPTKSACA